MTARVVALLACSFLVVPIAGAGVQQQEEQAPPVIRLEGPPLAYYPDDPLWVDADDHAIEVPSELATSAALEAVADSLLPGSEQEPQLYAANINTLGEVPDSSWFTNRHARRRMSLEELQRGPDRIGPPAPGPWKVTSLPADGRTPKLTIEDAEGRTYFVKLDSADHPELMSSAEVIGTKFFYAFGYHVPENHIVYFDRARLTSEGEDMSLDVLDLGATDEQGRLRAVASLMLEGEVIGPFRYTDTRPDDPNDIFPHEHRRELRGLAVFAAWLHHTDVKAGNTLDVYVGEDGRGHVRHHLIDFGSILGSAGLGAKDPVTGHERYFEPLKVLQSAVSLGLWARPYLRLRFPDHPAVGNLDAGHYHPARWKPPISNPAFEHMDAADAFWAARIISHFDADEIRAIVATAEISDPAAEETLVDLIEKRRQKTVRYWLTRTNPLDGFAVDPGAGDPALTFEVAAERLGIAPPGRGFSYRWHRFDNVARTAEPLTAETMTTDEGRLPVPEEAWGPADPFDLRYATVHIGTLHPDYPHWEEPVVVTLRRTAAGAEVVGIRHPREMPTTDMGEWSRPN